MTLDDLFSDIKRGLFIEGRGVSSIDQQRYNFQFGGAVIREISDGKLGAMVRDAAYQSRTPDFWASCDGLGGPATYRLWGTSADGKGEPGPDQRRQPRLSAGAVPASHGPEHGGALMLDSRRSAQDLRDGARAREGGGRRGRRRLAAKLGRIARALRRQPHHHERARRGPRHHRHRLGRPAARLVDRQRPGADALKQMADEAVQIARVSPVHREYVPTLGPLEYAEARGFADATADVDRRRARHGARGGAGGLPHREGDRRRLSHRAARRPPPPRPPTATAATSDRARPGSA